MTRELCVHFQCIFESVQKVSWEFEGFGQDGWSRQKPRWEPPWGPLQERTPWEYMGVHGDMGAHGSTMGVPWEYHRTPSLHHGSHHAGEPSDGEHILQLQLIL